jgi:RNA polymerase sigma-70 factor
MANDRLRDVRCDCAELIAEICTRVQAAYPGLAANAFADTIETSVRAWAGALDTDPSDAEIRSYIEALHAADLALACLCRAGDARAWETLFTQYRDALYAAARALTRDECEGRELADSLYADLFDQGRRDGRRRSLLDSFHGRSSLKTWMRAVLAQRFIDRKRATVRAGRLETELRSDSAAAADPLDPARHGYVEAFSRAFAAAIAELPSRDRMRLNFYYVEGLTLKEIGRLMNEYESSVSRRLLRSRKRLRLSVERVLRRDSHFDEDEIRACYALAMEEWSADLGRLFAET